MLHLCFLLLALSPQQQDKPLPEAKPFIEAFRKTLHRDSTLLSQYTYTEKETRIRSGRFGKTETNVYQVIRTAGELEPYRRHISKNGVPVSAKELEKQDRQERERLAKETRKSEPKRLQEKANDDREERELLDDVFGLYDIQLVRREPVNGTPAILVTFKAKPNYEPKTHDGKILQHIAGRAWIAEDDHELSKLEAEVIDPISIGAGILAKLQKGSTLTFERRKINDEIWLPVRMEASLNGRILFKGLNMRAITEYSDHKKYSVDTILKFGEETR